MKRASSARTSRSALEPEPYDKRKIDITKFKPDISVKEWQEMFKPFGNFPANSIVFSPIETLSPAKTIGLGRTNLTIVMATDVLTDTPTITPQARFDQRSNLHRKPAIQMRFEPAAYGITTAAGTYVMVFALDVAAGQSTFELGGSFGFLSNGGIKASSGGLTTLSLVFKNVPPKTHLFGFVRQRTGGRWTWFSTRVSFPPLVLSL